MALKQYKTYKDSGVEWIGDIPEHWEVKRLKFVIESKIDNRGRTPDFGEIGVPMLEVKQIIDNEMFPSNQFEKFVLPETVIKYERNVLKEGDVLIATVGATAGKCCIVPMNFNFFIAQNVIGFRADNNHDSKFLYYSIESSYFKESLLSINKTNTIDNLKVSIFVNNYLLSPSLQEQTQIANYLNHKTEQLDSLIAKKEQLIQLLHEERTAMINQAVTKGLDPNVPMKDSGIEWLGEIPAHWEVKRLKHIVKAPLKYGANESAEQENKEDPRYIRITDFGFDGKLRDNTFKSLPMEKAENFLLDEGDILFARSGATVGKTFMFNNYSGLACFAGYLIKASCDKNIMLPEFLYSFTNASGYDNWKDSIFQQATIQNIGADKYNQLKLAVPSIEEQKLIIEYILKEENIISKIVSKSEQEIQLLKEYKTALISEVVTGKVDVRNEVLAQ